MKTLDVREFRKAYGLKQKSLADLAGVTPSFISQVENGFSKLPAEILANILANSPYDTEPFMKDERDINIVAEASGRSKAVVEIGNVRDSEITMLRAEIASLKRQLEETRQEKERYWEMLQQLMKK